eukprot:18530-Heterococcus_DN1.PRE.4
MHAVVYKACAAICILQLPAGNVGRQIQTFESCATATLAHAADSTDRLQQLYYKSRVTLMLSAPVANISCSDYQCVIAQSSVSMPRAAMPQTEA